MLKKKAPNEKNQLVLMDMEALVPGDHMVRKISAVLDFDFVYDIVKDKYSADNGRPSIDPVILVKMVLIQYLFGIRSMRQTVKEIQVNVAYRWFLGLGMMDEVPHFTTFGKNYARRFEGTTLFEEIFSRILAQCYERGFVREEILFVDATHVKASANRNKRVKVDVQKEAARYAKELNAEIDADRERHGKKPFDRDDDDDPQGGSTQIRTVTRSTTDPESGMFVKGEHERSFAYMAQTACDRNGFVLGYEVVPGNVHDSASFPALYERLRGMRPAMLVMDAGYKTPTIVHTLLREGVVPLLPRTNPKTGKGFFRKYEYAYDEYHDCYLCPNNHPLSYTTTNRDGYREYKSKPYICKDCALREQCTHSAAFTKVVTRHVWQDDMDVAEHFRLSLGMREVYQKRKETIERVFADAKDKHGMRYTHYRGRAKLKFEIGLIFAAMNLKKLATWVAGASFLFRFISFFLLIPLLFSAKPVQVLT